VVFGAIIVLTTEMTRSGSQESGRKAGANLPNLLALRLEACGIGGVDPLNVLTGSADRQGWQASRQIDRQGIIVGRAKAGRIAWTRVDTLLLVLFSTSLWQVVQGLMMCCG